MSHRFKVGLVVKRAIERADISAASECIDAHVQCFSTCPVVCIPKSGDSS